ncbi:exodeoxyribonuclease V subunit gamma [Cyanobium sp. CH-040]|uniref:exodeoxyribonuclease V subunit gamma n=1 Tax=Cyanobium sp. CH-040 TaxID=2823708 RepID=UPI0020CF2F93|nr:exodeoxyribonuclease V subunit gamma [Cyanobium sp. CH-040]MCP9927663.1 exodeoxyribonuclease V subunit gamma [Cyanobium sp. CH-040]
MLTVFRSNRAELLASVLATQLRLAPPPPFEQVQVLVNTWPTSRWLGEQLALGLGDPEAPFADGVAANLRFPFPGTHLRQLVDQLLADAPGPAPAPDRDPWRAADLVWPLLDLLPALIARPEAAALRRWLAQRGPGDGAPPPGDRLALDRPLWQLARAIADAFDDYTLYRPELLAAWLDGRALDDRGQPLPAAQRWQPLLFGALAERLGRPPFGLQVRTAISRLQEAAAGAVPLARPLPDPVRLFGLSSMAPVQVELLQALSGLVQVELYLLTPCRELWRRGDRAAGAPLGEDWLLEAPRLEARFGRLGAEFQQLLEGTGAEQLGRWQERDLFVGAASAAEHAGRSPTLLEQLQEQLVDPELRRALELRADDQSLEFLACPGLLRQVQIVRDRVLQLMAADPSLAPRDVLVMTPQVDAFAPLVAAVFGDGAATGVALPWRLTDRSQQSDPGIAQGLLALLELGGERLTASAFEGLLACTPLLAAHGIDPGEAGAIVALLQRAGFRWGLDGRARGGDPAHSLAWAIDRLVLGLVLPEQPGLAPADTAPLAMGLSLDEQSRWLALLLGLRRALTQLEQPRTPAGWGALLRQLLPELFGDGGERAWDLQAVHNALADWLAAAGASALELPAAVVAEVLGERLAADSGRFGHRSGALTVSGLEPMRAIPHRVIVLMGLDGGSFPRQRERPGFHLMEHGRRLGDPSPADQDRYVLLESLLSARQHLLITWSSRDSRTGENLMPCTPVRQWLALLEQELGAEAMARVLREPAANPLERRNFLTEAGRPPICSDRRLLQARRLLEEGRFAPPTPLARQPSAAAAGAVMPTTEQAAHADLLAWLQAPQAAWLESLGLRPREWAQQVLDREALALDERQRARLLREALQRPEPEMAPDWVAEQRGRGILPAGAAAHLEAGRLDQRWLSLQAVLRELGEERSGEATAAGLAATLSWRGGRLVLVHTARPRPAKRLELWLVLLLACAADQQPREALLVGRDGHAFRRLETLTPLPAAAAAVRLEQLRELRERHRQRCWPAPPLTGWAWAEAEWRRPGSGFRAAVGAWEGGFGGPGEREEEVMAFCFGSGTTTRELLGGDCGPAAQQLLTPLLEQRSVEKTGGRRR